MRTYHDEGNILYGIRDIRDTHTDTANKLNRAFIMTNKTMSQIDRKKLAM